MAKGVSYSQGYMPSLYKGFVLPNTNPNLNSFRQGKNAYDEIGATFSVHNGFTLPNANPNLSSFRKGKNAYTDVGMNFSTKRGFLLPNERYRSSQGNPSRKLMSDKVFIKDNNNGWLMYLPSMPTVEESFQVATYSESPVGSDIPVAGFSSMGARKVSISFDIDQSYLPLGYYTVEAYVDRLRSLIYPRYKGTTVISPECTFQLISMTVIGICESMNVTWGNTVRGRSVDSAKVSISIMETSRSVGGSAS